MMKAQNVIVVLVLGVQNLMKMDIIVIHHNKNLFL